MGILKSKVDVIIPVYRAEKKLFKLLEGLAGQTVLPAKVILLNVETGKKEDSSEEVQSRIYRYFRKHKLFGNKLPMHLEIIPVKEDKFDEGATRTLGFRHSDSPFLLYMAQNAVPADSQMIEELLWGLEDGADVSYGRHITGVTADVLKTYVNLYDYPSKSYVRTVEDVKKYGTKAYRISNACAMYRRDALESQGGFVNKIITGEGNLFGIKLLKRGGKISYCAHAKVYYSESSNWLDQLRRKFDEGVAQAKNSREFRREHIKTDGLEYGKSVLGYLFNQKYYMEIADFIGGSLFQWAGYLLGRNYQLLKKEWILQLTNHRGYWSKE